MTLRPKIIITGAAGLVGQNLVPELLKQGYASIVAIDKHANNLAVLARLNPTITTVHADLSSSGSWAGYFSPDAQLVQLHSQITGIDRADFIRNNVESTRLVLDAADAAGLRHVVHVSTSAQHSVVATDYSLTKGEQEGLVTGCGIPFCVLRPTLMFGLFDPKHLGWLSRFMERSPVFPIPGDGRFVRQPLYVRDFCKVIMRCIEIKPLNKVYDLCGERIAYIDLIRAIRDAKNLKTTLLCIPRPVFYILLRTYAILNDHPPFTADQLVALTAGDEFPETDMGATFGVASTPLAEAILETFNDERADVELDL